MTRSASREHVLNKGNNWDLGYVLLMPGERIYTEPEYTKSNGFCICLQIGWTDVPYVNHYYTGAGLYMGWPPGPHNPNYPPHKPSYVDTTCLIDSSADAGKMTPITQSYNAFTNIGIAGDFLTHSEDADLNGKNSEYVSKYKGCSVNSGYINNTGLPVIFSPGRGGVSQCGYNPYADLEVESYAGHEHYPASVNYSASCAVGLTFLEPYYEFDYKIDDRWKDLVGFTEEELAMIKESCEGFYVKPEEQEIPLPQLPLRPGRRHTGWRSSYRLFVEDSYNGQWGTSDVRIEDGKYIHIINEDSILRAGTCRRDLNDGFDPINRVTALYEPCYTITFNPNGGELPEGVEPFREFENQPISEKFININNVVPVREGYTFAGWGFTPHPVGSVYDDAESGGWLNEWKSRYSQDKLSTPANDHDIQLYAVWEGEYISELEDTDADVSIQLTDGVPKDATFSVDKIAAESVLGSRPELAGQLTDVRCVYQMDVLADGKALEVKDNPMEFRLPLDDDIKGYDFYQVVYLGEKPESIYTRVSGDSLEFKFNRLGQFAIIGTNTPFTRQELDRIHLENASLQDAMKAGKTPAFTATVADADKNRYAITLEQWSGSDGKTITSSAAFNENIPEEQRLTTFEKGVTYTYSVRVEAKPKYFFNKDTVLDLNGEYYWDIRAEDLGVREDFTEIDADVYFASGTFQVCLPAVTELVHSDTNVSISLTDGVPEGSKLFVSADEIVPENVIANHPELKSQLDGILDVYEFSLSKDGNRLEIEDNPMTVKIPLNDQLKGYKYYQAVLLSYYMDKVVERKDASVEGNFLTFQTDHMGYYSIYAIVGSNEPFGEGENPETVKKGDVDADGKVSVQDLRLLLRHVCGKTKLEGDALKAADLVGNDGKADIQDLRYLLRVICGKVKLE